MVNYAPINPQNNKRNHFGLICMIWIATIVLTYTVTSNNQQHQIIQSKITSNCKPCQNMLNDNNPKLFYDNQGKQIQPKSLLINSGSKKGEIFQYNHTTPIIFIGGMPRSGTTLMRVMMDAHPEVRCGEETRLVPRILDMRNYLYNTGHPEKKKLVEAGVTENVVDEAHCEKMVKTRRFFKFSKIFKKFSRNF